MMTVRRFATILVLVSLPEIAFPASPAGVGLASDPVDALANALPELAKLFCEAAGVSYHQANEIFLAERRRYPEGVPLTLHFRINRARTSIEDPKQGCIFGFEPAGGTVGPFEPNVMSATGSDLNAVNATGLGPPLTRFPGVSLRIEPQEISVTLGQEAVFGELIARFEVRGVEHEWPLRPNDATWDSSDRDAVMPISDLEPGEGPVMTAPGGARAQRFSTHRTGRYSVLAALPSGATTSARVEVLPGLEMLAHWRIRYHDPEAGGEWCGSGSFRVQLTEDGGATGGSWAMECTRALSGGEVLYSLCPLPREQAEAFAGKLLGLRVDPVTGQMTATFNYVSGKPEEAGTFTGVIRRDSSTDPPTFSGTGEVRLPWVSDGVRVGWAPGTWQTDGPTSCLSD